MSTEQIPPASLSDRSGSMPRRLITPETGVKRLDELGARHAELVEEHREARAQLNALHEERKTAVTADHRAAAAAIAAKRKDPGTPLTTEVAEKITAQSRRVSLLKTAADQIAAEYLAEFNRQRGEITDRARARLAEHRAAALHAFEELGERLSELGASRSFARWADVGPDRPESRNPPREVAFGDRHFSVDAVLHALAEAIDSPARVERALSAVTEAAAFDPAVRVANGRNAPTDPDFDDGVA